MLPAVIMCAQRRFFFSKWKNYFGDDCLGFYVLAYIRTTHADAGIRSVVNAIIIQTKHTEGCDANVNSKLMSVGRK